jgi:hypothetical protein
MGRSNANDCNVYDELRLDMESIILEMTPQGWRGMKLTRMGWFRAIADTIEEVHASIAAQIRSARAAQWPSNARAFVGSRSGERVRRGRASYERGNRHARGAHLAALDQAGGSTMAHRDKNKSGKNKGTTSRDERDRAALERARRKPATDPSDQEDRERRAFHARIKSRDGI